MSLSFDVVNAWSVIETIGLLHDVIYDQNVDILAVTETWVCESEPDTIKIDLAPPGYAVLPVHQGKLKQRAYGSLLKKKSKTEPHGPVD